MIRAAIHKDKARLEELQGLDELERKEKLLYIRMLETKIKVEESLYGMNLVKTVGLAGASISGVMNLLGIRLSQTIATKTKVDITADGISVESQAAEPLTHAKRAAVMPEQKGLPETQDIVAMPSPSGGWFHPSLFVDHAYVVLLFGVVTAIAIEKLHERYKKKKEAL